MSVIVLRNTLDSQDKLIGALLTTGMAICALFPFHHWLVRRARDSGIGKIAYLSMGPLINLIVLIYLLSKKLRRRQVGCLMSPAKSFE